MKIAIFLTILLISTRLLADTGPRYCGIDDISRDSKHVIIMSKAEYNRFRSWWKYPSSMEFVGPCVDWSVDHIVPIAVGGCDRAENMQWLKLEIKSCSGVDCKDRWERNVYSPDSRQN